MTGRPSNLRFVILAFVLAPLAACQGSDVVVLPPQAETEPPIYELGGGVYHCAAASTYEGCPADAPAEDQPCALPALTLCDYRYTQGDYQGIRGCSCVPTVAGNRWHCGSGSL